MSQLDRKVDYTLYTTFVFAGKHFADLDVWTAPGGGHADEVETSMMMAAAPGTVKMEQQCYAEPIEPLEDLKHLSDNNIHTALWWYGLYPENVSGSPSAGTSEKGEAALNAAALDVAEALRIIKADTAAPRIQQEYYERVHGVKKGE